MEDWEKVCEEEYDVIVCGTGMKECILSGLLSLEGKKILHIDRSPYYGGDCASLNLKQLWKKFLPDQAEPQGMGRNPDWNVDLISKFIMASGELVSMLIKTKVDGYMEFKSVESTFVYQYQAPGMFSAEKFFHKTPSQFSEVMASNLMNLVQKTKCQGFFAFVLKFDPKDQETWTSNDSGPLHPERNTMMEVFKAFGLGEDTREFMGHAVALHTNDEYLRLPYGESIMKMKLYIRSIAAYGKSPFIYPTYGLGGIAEAFSRLSAVHGGTFMLSADVDGPSFGPDGNVEGVSWGGKVAKSKMVICDPTYVQDKAKFCRPLGKVIRAICILRHTVPETNDVSSAQVIIPQRQLNRRNDVYISILGYEEKVCPQGFYLAMVSTVVETDSPELEIKPALDRLQPIEQTFTTISDLYEPTSAGLDLNLFVAPSYDAASHFESATEDVKVMYKKITGKDLDLSSPSEGGAGYADRG